METMTLRERLAQVDPNGKRDKTLLEIGARIALEMVGCSRYYGGQKSCAVAHPDPATGPGWCDRCTLLASLTNGDNK